jgi:hypothetical protein
LRTTRLARSTILISVWEILFSERLPSEGAKPGREVKSPGHRLASDPEGRRRILAKDFARTHLAPQRRHDPAAGLAHDHKLPDTVHSGLNQQRDTPALPF